MGAEVNKQYLSLGGWPILAHTLSLFENHLAVDSITLIAPEDEIGFCRDDIVSQYGFTKVRQIVVGGKERQDSVRNGLRACAAAEDDIVLIHDGVRPLLPPDLIDAAIEKAVKAGAALVAVPVKDTVKVVDQGQVLQTPERSTLWLAQTPQAFRYQIIATAHEKAYKEAYQATDDAQLAEWAGLKVHIVQGDYSNLKITTPEDLAVAERLLANKNEAES